MKPFHVRIPQHELDDLRRRLSATRRPPPSPGGADRGVEPGYVDELAEQWRSEFDWRETEAKLNGFPQYVTEIDGVDVHFLHVRSPEPGAPALLLTHGWPGSIVEFLDVAGPLADPVAHGGSAADAFDLVIPSLPGHGFSGVPAEPGWDYRRIARAWAELMRRLGYGAYFAQGGDHGSFVALELGLVDPGHVKGVHVNMLMVPPPEDPAEFAALSGTDAARVERMVRFDQELSGYMKIQATRPATLAHGLTDSPAGQLAWIAEKFRDWSDWDAKPEEAIDRDTLLANVSLYWFTRTAGPAAQLYYEARGRIAELTTPGFRPEPLEVPIGVLVLGGDFAPVRRFAERSYPSITHWTEYERGGHFASLERPEEFVADVRAFCRAVR
jgi:pimeloyl-ACP methyl ester carboxylesterase